MESISLLPGRLDLIPSGQPLRLGATTHCWVLFPTSCPVLPALRSPTHFLATSSTLTLSLVDCIDDQTWENYFYTLTGANPATTTVTREEGDAGNCKGSEAGKIVASGFTLVITSSSVPAAALASQLASTVGSPAGAALGVASASVVSGAAGANAAGFATTIAALSGTTVVAPAVAAGGGGGGGAAG